jgi:hypothetical protein
MDTLHGEFTAMLLTSITMAAWVMKGLLGETRDRVGRRLADWLVPLGQPVTYRLARLALALSRRVAPRNRTSLLIAQSYVRYPRKPLLPGFNPTLIHGRLNWEDLEAAAAELEIDQQQSEPIAKPVRFVAPLLLRALGIRLTNFAVRAAFLVAVLIVRPQGLAIVFLFRFMGRALTFPLDRTLRTFRRLDRRAAQVLLRLRTRQLPDEVREEERSFWMRAMNCGPMRRRHSWTAQITLDAWIRMRQRLTIDHDDAQALDREQKMDSNGS